MNHSAPSCTPTRYDWSSGYPHAIPSSPMKITRKLRMVLDSVAFGWAGAMVLGALLLLTGGCGAVNEPAEPRSPDDLAVSPVPELEQGVQSAADRIEAATGIRIPVQAGGLPVYLQDTVWLGDAEICAATRYRNEVAFKIEVSARREGLIRPGGGPTSCASKSIDEVHELLHLVLGSDDIHSLTGVFKSGANDDTINAEVLEVVCSRVACSTFAPEAP